MAGFVKQSFLKDKRMEVIKNGVDLKVFRPDGNDNPNDNQNFGILAVSSVWNEDKGLSDIYKLRDLLPSEYCITIVGLTEKQLGSLPHGITGIRRTQNVHELVRLYSSANVLINPTYADTFPTVNLEALACGTPVVTYRTGGSPESVTTATGRVVEQGDINGLSEAIMEICLKGKEQFTNACRLRAEDYFDKNKCFEKYIKLYESILDNH